MDFDLKQCRTQRESEEQQHSAKISKLFVEQPHHHLSSSSTSVLPLFVLADSNNSKTSNILSAFQDSTSSTLPRMLGYFSVAQRQELELQALIFRYMLAGAAVPPELLHPIKKSLISSSSTTPFFLHHPLQHFPHYPTSLLQAGYWGRAAMDPEPGRCRRTDGKKWRCSRDVVAGQKYCERHMHRGRNRSRKPVETTTTNHTTTVAAGGGGGGCSLSSNSNRVIGGGGGRPFLTVESGNYFSMCGQTPSVDLLHLNQGSCSNSLSENKKFYESHKEPSAGDVKSDGHILRHFFDDWPRSENGGCGDDNNSINQRMNSTSASATSLSISMPGNPPSSSSDVSLKLSTGGSSDQDSDHHIHQNGDDDREHVQLNWAAGWAATQMASMGGPLAEALRSANNNSLPTSVLHQLQRTTNSEASFIST